MESSEIIGRQEELAQVDRALEDARAGRGRVVFLAGEAGVGKTRLAEHALAASGLDVFTGRARQDSTPPFGPIAGVLRECLRRSPDAAGGPLSAHLSLLLPELGPPPDHDRPNLLEEAILAALAQSAGQRPIAIFMDDLQWADDASLEFLPLLADRIATEPAVVVAAYRSDEIARGHSMRRLRDELRRARRLHEIRLDPLVRDDTARLLHRALGERPHDSLVEIVHAKTLGVPLYVEELATALQLRGHLESDESGVSLASEGPVPVPDTIRDAVMLRLDALSEPARIALDIAAVAGMEADLEMIAGLADGDQGIGELLEGNLLVEAGAGCGAFRNSLVRDAIRGEIAWSKRRSLNRRIAAYLERAGAPPERVAGHWLAAHEYEPARRALLQLADHSCRLHAYRDALRAGHRALEIWPEGEQDGERLDALERVAHCAQVSGHLVDAVRALREIADSSAVTSNRARYARTMRALATVHGLQGAWGHAMDARTSAAEAFEQADEPGEAALEFLAIAGRHTSNSALDRALETIRATYRLVEDPKHTNALIRLKGFEGNILAMMGQPDAGRSLAQEALSLALQENETDAAAEAYRRLASVLDYNSDFGGSRDAYTAALDYCTAHGDDANARVCLSCMSAIVYRTGDWKRSLEVGRQVIANPDSATGSRSVAHGFTGLIRALRGELRSARTSLNESQSLARTGDVAIMNLISRFGLALIAEFEGEESRAADLHQEVLHAWRDTQDRHDIVPVLLWQSTFFARSGDEAATIQRADALSTIASQTGNPETMAALAHALGEFAGLSDRNDEAVQHFEQALAHTEKLEIPLEHAVTSWRLGTASARGGDREASARHLSGAYRLARNLGARPLAAWIQGELEDLGENVEEGGRPDEASLAARGGLTRRQAEITRLLADGLTNKEIAQKLFLSPRTIDMHVGNVLERLDCRSRTEAARKASDLGLLD